MNLTKKHKTLIIRLSIGIFLLIALILYINVKAIKEIVNILVISIILAYILLPIKRYGIKKFNIKDGYMALIIILFIVGVFLSVIFFLRPSMFNEISSLGPSIDKLYEYIEDLKNKFNFLNAPLFNFLYETIKEKATAAFVTITEGILEGVIKFSEDLVSIAIVPVVTYYFLADTTSIVKRVYMFIPIEKRNFVKTII